MKRNWFADYAAHFDDDSEPINAYRMLRELWSRAGSGYEHDHARVRRVT